MMSYSCYLVATAVGRLCSGYEALRLTGPQGYLANIITEDTQGCGGESVPWRIEAQPGQRINLTLIDFMNGYASGAAR